MTGSSFPLRHLSIRGPWHDSGCAGTVCRRPKPHEAAYRRRWEEELVWYRGQGVLPIEEGGGPKGTLIVTGDQPDGGIDSQSIAALISSVFMT